MTFRLGEYIKPDFSRDMFRDAPEAAMAAAPRDMTAPEGFHATSIFPEYFKVGENWILPEDSRMDCVAVYEDGKIAVKEFRNIKKAILFFWGARKNARRGYTSMTADSGSRERNRRKKAPFHSGRAEAGKQLFHTIIPACTISLNTRGSTAI